MAVQGIENSVLAFLAAVGIAALVWLVAGNAAAGHAGEVPATLVLPVCGGGEAPEGWVRALHEMRRSWAGRPRYSLWIAASAPRECAGRSF